MSPRARWLAVEIALKAGIVVFVVALLGVLVVIPKSWVPASTGIVLGIFTWDTLRLARRPRCRDEDVVPVFLSYVQLAILAVALWLEIAHGHAVSFAVGLAIGAMLRSAKWLVANSAVVRRHEDVRARGFDG